ncbi:MAG TPA: zinc-binding dehydrogenase, partial [Chloroflexota bacterium]|nr:zinc-binding dehydrogenase [Chloroflexota bacterium]
FPLPRTLSGVHGALVEPTAVAYHAVKRSGLTPGQSVLLVGAGPIGLAIIQAARAAGAGEIVVREPSSARRQAALSLGAICAVDPREDESGEAVREHFGSAGVEVTFEAAGTQPALAAALAALAKRGVCVVVSAWAGEARLDALSLLRREIDIRFAFGCEALQDFPAVLRLMSAGTIDAGAIVSDQIALEDIVAQGYEELLANREKHVKILVNPHR